MEQTYLDDLKDIQGTFLPILESTKIEYAFNIGRLCVEVMAAILEMSPNQPIEQIRIDCQDELGLSKNQVQNTALLYHWTKENGMIVDDSIHMDILYNYWERLQGGQVTLAKLYRLICPKPAKEDRAIKKTTLKRQIGKAINEADYIDFKALDGAKMILNVNEAV